MHAFGVASVVEQLRAVGGGYEVVLDTPGLELGVYVLIAPEADKQQPHEDDEVDVVLEGTGTLTVDGTEVRLMKATRSSSRLAPSTASPRTSSSHCS